MTEKKRNLCVTLRPKTIEILKSEQERLYKETGLVVSLSGLIDMVVSNYGYEKKNGVDRSQTSILGYGEGSSTSREVYR